MAVETPVTEPPKKRTRPALTFLAGCLTGAAILWAVGLLRLPTDSSQTGVSGIGTGAEIPGLIQPTPSDPAPAEPLAATTQIAARYPYRLAGRVLDPDGHGMGSATVTAHGRADGAPDDLGAETAPDGSFEILSVPLGIYTVEARAEGYAAATVRGVSPDTLDLELVLEPQSELVGRVVRDGAGVEGVTVLVGGSGMFPPDRVVSGRDGHFPLHRPSSRSHLVLAAFAADAGSGFGAVVGPSGSSQVTLDLRPAPAWTIAVRDAATGQAVAGGVVAASGDALHLLSVAEPIVDGQVHLSGFPEGTYYLRVRAPGYLPWSGPVANRPGAPDEILLRTGASLAVTVLGPGGQPLSGVRLQPVVRDELGGRWILVPNPERDVDRLVRTDGSPLWAPPYQPETDGNGQATISGLPRGRVLVRADRPGFAPFESDPFETDGETAQSLEITLVPE